MCGSTVDIQSMVAELGEERKKERKKEEK